jgi:hypothetical protein
VLHTGSVLIDARHGRHGKRNDHRAGDSQHCHVSINSIHVEFPFAVLKAPSSQTI